MATQVQRRRGTAAEHNTFTGAAGEVTVNTTNDSLHVHDGATAGGFELSRADGQNANMPISAMPAGSVLQMQTVELQNRFVQSLTANVHGIISEFDLTITPFRSNSTILLQVSSLLEFNNANVVHDHTFALFRGSTRLGPPDDGNRNVGIAVATRTFDQRDDNSTPEYLSFHFTDQPNTTSQVTYRLSAKLNVNDVITFNTVIDTANVDSHEIGVSTFTAMEIAG